MQTLHPDIILRNIRKKLFGDNILPIKKIEISIGKRNNIVSDEIINDFDFVNNMQKQKLQERKYLCYNDNTCIVSLEDDCDVKMSLDFYSEFEKKLQAIINSWDNEYSGDIDIVWQIKIYTENMQKNYVGNGNISPNWNQLLDLLSSTDLVIKNQLNSERQK